MKEDTKQTTNLKKRTRSIAYPSLELEDAIKCTEELRKKLGMGPYNREVAAKALGYGGVSGASATKIAALVHFGLLSRSGNAYSQSPLADTILVPPSEEEKARAIIEAIKTPKLFNRLISDYEGKSLPTLLSNVLFHTHKVNQKVAKKVADNFIKSTEFAGILVNGVIVGSANDIAPTKPVPEAQTTPNHEAGQTRNEKAQKKKPVSGNMSIQLGPDITVTFSDNLTREVSKGTFAKVLNELEKLANKK